MNQAFAMLYNSWMPDSITDTHITIHKQPKSMAKYSSQPVSISGSQSDVYNKISNLGAYQELLDKMPDDLRQKAGDVHFTDDAIIINANPVGEIRLEIIDRHEPDMIKLKASNAPVPMFLSLELAKDTDTTTRLVAVIEVEVPAILKPMIGPKMQEAANQMATLIGRLFNGNNQQ